VTFSRVDGERLRRTGVPEVVYGESKNAVQIAAIMRELYEQNGFALATRVGAETGRMLEVELAGSLYDPVSRVLRWGARERSGARTAVVCAGTTDLPVAEEAAVTLEAFGHSVERFADVGVAGIHRTLEVVDDLNRADSVIVVAGMEGALPSVVAGLIRRPVIAVPTSVGYGAAFGGITALLGMLNACAPGVAVVNIDNGFGAAALAHKIALAVKA